MSRRHAEPSRSPFCRTASALALGATLALSLALPVPAQDAASLTDSVGARPLSFADLASKVSPSVVNITTTTVISGRTGPQDFFPKGSPFDDFFREFEDRSGPSRPQRSQALGSGFVISADGYIVTNNHVIQGADQIEIEFFPVEDQPARRLPATVIGTDKVTDIALLKVDSPEPLPFVEFGDSDGEAAEVGDWVMAMGNPLGQGFSVSAGIISARNRALGQAYDDYIQTDAAINQGNSGGPLFNMDGEVIGVNTAILSPTGGSIGIGFAMASDVVTDVVGQLKEFGETRRGWLGVVIQNVSEDMADAIEGLDRAEGALVTTVPEGPSMAAGIEPGDVILSFDGAPVASSDALVRMVGSAPIGKEVPLTVLRDGETLDLTVTLGRRETASGTDAGPDGAPMEGEEAQILGLTLEPLTEKSAEAFGLQPGDGVLITDIDPAGDAAEKGLRPGDLITEAGQRPVSNVSDMEQAVQDARDAGRKSILLLVRRGGEPRFVALSISE